MKIRGIKIVIILVIVIGLIITGITYLENKQNNDNMELAFAKEINILVENMMELYQLTLQQYKNQYITQSEFIDFLNNIINLNKNLEIEIYNHESSDASKLLIKYIQYNIKGYTNIKTAIEYNDTQYNKKAENDFKEVKKINIIIKKIE